MEMIRAPYSWPVHLWLTYAITCEQRPWRTDDLMATAYLKGKEKGQGTEEPQVYAGRSLLPPSGHTGTKQVEEGSQSSMEKGLFTAALTRARNCRLSQRAPHRQLLSRRRDEGRTLAPWRRGQQAQPSCAGGPGSWGPSCSFLLSHVLNGRECESATVPESDTPESPWGPPVRNTCMANDGPQTAAAQAIANPP